MKTFKDLAFKEHSIPSFGGSVAKMFFDNGYGVSVIAGGRSYTTAGTYELAVLKGNKNKWSLNYETDITDDVIRHQSEAEITKLLQRIQGLVDTQIAYDEGADINDGATDDEK